MIMAYLDMRLIQCAKDYLLKKEIKEIFINLKKLCFLDRSVPDNSFWTTEINGVRTPSNGWNYTCSGEQSIIPSPYFLLSPTSCQLLPPTFSFPLPHVNYSPLLSPFPYLSLIHI